MATLTQSECNALRLSAPTGGITLLGTGDAAPADTITVTSPTGASDWQEGDNQNITWDFTGLAGATVAITLSLDGGSTFPQTLATGIAIADQTWAWNPVEAGLDPGAEETDAVIRVEEE